MTATDMTRLEGRIAERITPNVTGKMQVGSTGLAIKDMAQLLEFAKIMAIGGVSVPKHLRGNPGACIAVCLQAIEWQMSPFAVANNSYSVNDRLAYQSAVIHAVLVKRAPIKGRPKFEYTGEGPTRQCKVTCRLLDEPDEVVDYTSPPFAEIPIKNSPLWKADPDQQLGYYSVRALARRHFPDTILGVIEREEARYNAIDGDYEEDPAQQQAAAKPAKPSLDQRLADLAGDPRETAIEAEPEPLPDPEPTIASDYVDEDGVIHDEGPAPEREPERKAAPKPKKEARGEREHEMNIPAELTDAARKGPRGLKLFLGKLSQEDFDSIPKAWLAQLDTIAKYVAMKTGEGDD